MKLASLTNPFFQSALSKLIAQPLPLRAAFKLKGTATKVKEEFAKFEECRTAALNKYGTKDEAGKLVLKNDNVEFTAENLALFSKEFNELGTTELEVPSIKLSELGEKLELSADELLILGDIVVDG